MRYASPSVPYKEFDQESCSSLPHCCVPLPYYHTTIIALLTCSERPQMCPLSTLQDTNCLAHLDLAPVSKMRQERAGKEHVEVRNTAGLRKSIEQFAIECSYIRHGRRFLPRHLHQGDNCCAHRPVHRP